MRKHASVKVSKFIEEAQVSLSEGSKGKNETFPVVIEIASSTLKDSLSKKKIFIEIGQICHKFEKGFFTEKCANAKKLSFCKLSISATMVKTFSVNFLSVKNRQQINRLPL